MEDYGQLGAISKSIDGLNRTMERIADALEKLGPWPATPGIKRAMEELRDIFADAGFNLPPKDVRPCDPPWERPPMGIPLCDHKWRGPLFINGKIVAACIKCMEIRIVSEEEGRCIDEASTIHEKHEALKILENNKDFQRSM